MECVGFLGVGWCWVGWCVVFVWRGFGCGLGGWFLVFSLWGGVGSLGVAGFRFWGFDYLFGWFVLLGCCDFWVLFVLNSG